MSKKKKKKPPQKKADSSVKLSQCMIVKNEGKNIERALEWAKDIAYEQIVVDTGSTDKTVELAEKMGAKVYHFDWINDFSAAKNYAMDLAKGDWIAFLDADEYMTKKDANELYLLLKKIKSDPEAAVKCDAIQCTFINLDDNDNAISIINHQRFFQNRPYLRFEGKIHEVIKLRYGFLEAPNIRIYHTGYTNMSYKETNKKERNKELLRKELEEDPDNPDIMLYLADSIKNSGNEEDFKEAEELFHKALTGKREIKNKHIKQLAYNFLIHYSLKNETKNEETIILCNEAIECLPDFIDYYYYRALLYNKTSNYRAALDDLTVCEKALLSPGSIPTTNIMISNPVLLYNQLLISSKGIKDQEEIIKNETIIKVLLQEGKNQTEIIGPYIRAILEQGKSDEEVLNELAVIYDLNDPKDLLFIARAAKEGGAVDFTRNIMKIAGQMLGEDKK